MTIPPAPTPAAAAAPRAKGADTKAAAAPATSYLFSAMNSITVSSAVFVSLQIAEMIIAETLIQRLFNKVHIRPPSSLTQVQKA